MARTNKQRQAALKPVDHSMVVATNMQQVVHEQMEWASTVWIAAVKHIEATRALRTAVQIGSDFVLIDWLKETKCAANLFDTLNDLSNKIETAGGDLYEVWPTAAPRVTEMVKAINAATERGDLAPLRALMQRLGDPDLRRLFTVDGVTKRSSKESPVDRWIGDQLLALWGLHHARECAEIILRGLEYQSEKESLTTLEVNAMFELKVRLGPQNEGSFREWARRRKMAAEQRAIQKRAK